MRPEASGPRVCLEAAPLALLLGIGSWLISEFVPGPLIARADTRAPITLDIVTPADATELAALFDAVGYYWPATDSTVPPLAVKTLPEGLAELPVADKKSLFFRSLLPLVLAENARIRAERRRLLSLIEAGGARSDEQRSWLRDLMQRYQVDGDPAALATLATLKRRVDTVPPALALAQAAIESGWGTSRFAQQGNNLFGEWTWSAEAGLIPRQRPADADYFVRRFDTLRASVASYLNNLNTHPAYRSLRERRQAAREAGRELDPARLAAGLSSYSARGEEYIREIRALLHYNSLAAAVDGVSLNREFRLAENRGSEPGDVN
jgi:Bax protein